MKMWKTIIGILFLAGVSVWLANFSSTDKKLQLIACDVGQGDATLAVWGKTEILIDGGPDNKVLDCLGRHLPYWDREIELVILTHPDKDHFAGLIEVFKRYKVDNYLYNPIENKDSGSQSYQALEKAVGGSRVSISHPTKGMVIRLGLLYLDMYSDYQADISDPAVKETQINDTSIVVDLRLGNFRAILTGDIGENGIANIFMGKNQELVDYIKIPHHGSKTGGTKKLINYFMPKIAVISVGKDNSYGHPHKEILDFLKENQIPFLRTDEKGDVEVVTDGKTWSLAN